MCGVVATAPYAAVAQPLATVPATSITASRYAWNPLLGDSGGYQVLSGPIPCGTGFWVLLNNDADVRLGLP